MADLTTTVAPAVAAGISAAALNELGLAPNFLGLSFAACIVGASFAPEMSKARQMAVFMAAVVCSAVAGKFIALRWWDSGALTQAVWVIIVGILFHPCVAFGVKVLPKLGARVTGTQQETDK